MAEEKIAMTSEEKIGPSDLRAKAEKMLRDGTMPRLDDVLSAVAAARKQFAEPIRRARLRKVESEE